jgi:hypothetical protein
MWRRAALVGLWLCALPAAAGAPPAAAVREPIVRVDSTTFVYTRPEWRAGETDTFAPIIQWLGVTARGIDTPVADDLRFQLSAWGQLQPVPLAGEKNATGDVDVAYVQGRLLNQRLGVTLGRQLVTGGAARILHLDGANVDVRVAGGLGVTAFGGLQTIPRFDVASGDNVVGGRLYYRHSFDTEVGASIINVMDDGEVGRRDVGFDARWAPFPELALTGSTVFSLEEEMDLVDGEVSAQYVLFPTVMVRADVRRSAPDLYISRASIFSVFSSEERDAYGGAVFWEPVEPLGVSAEYHRVRIRNEADIPDDRGHDIQGQVTVRPLRRTRLGVDGRFLDMPGAGYRLARVWLRHALSNSVAMSLFGEGTRLIQPVNGEDTALLGGATASWAFARSWRAMVSGALGSSPFFDRQYELSARLSYEISPFSGARP